MKVKLYTLAVLDAVKANTECPFCFIEKKIEEDAIEFVLGSSASYMERDVRAVTDEKGFCNYHFKKMFDYGNALGNAWILKTHYLKKQEELKKAFHKNRPEKNQKKFSFASKKEEMNSVSKFIQIEKESCYICNQMKRDYDRYMDTFIVLYRKDPEFKKKILESKGFCITHLGDICNAADEGLKGDTLSEFYKEMENIMILNLERIYEDISWLIEKYDYRNKDADWKNSKDAVQRGMQKLKGNF